MFCYYRSLIIKHFPYLPYWQKILRYRAVDTLSTITKTSSITLWKSPRKEQQGHFQALAVIFSAARLSRRCVCISARAKITWPTQGRQHNVKVIPIKKKFPNTYTWTSDRISCCFSDDVTTNLFREQIILPIKNNQRASSLLSSVRK